MATTDLPLHDPPIDRATLHAPLRTALRCTDLAIADWTIAVLRPGLGAHGGVYSITGTAVADGQPTPWSLILKILCPAERSEPPGLAQFAIAESTDPASSLLYWQREALAYASGTLAALPDGVVAPRCFGVEARDADACWLWLEAVTDVSEPDWPVARYGMAAFHLGRFNGAYLAGRACPEAAWLSRDWLRRITERAAPAVARLVEVEAYRGLRHWLEPDIVARVQRGWAVRHQLLAALDRLPHTLCHHDAHRFNLLLQHTPAGQDQLVAIDWSAVGPGPIGADVALLAGIAIASSRVAAPDHDALSDAAFAGYVAGLGTVGAVVDPQQARLGYTATLALKVVISNLPGMLFSWMNEGWYSAYEQHSGQSIEQLAASFAHNTRWLLDRADEALTLAGAAP